MTPTGNNVQEFWQGICAGKVGIGPITRFDTQGYKVKLAAEVKGFEPKKYMEPKQVRRMALFSQYAVAAAKEAFEDSGLDMKEEDAFRAGVIIGSGVGDLRQVELCYDRITQKGPGRALPLMVPMTVSYTHLSYRVAVLLFGPQCRRNCCIFPRDLHRLFQTIHARQSND